MTTPSFTPKKYLIEFYDSNSGVIHGSVTISKENGSFLSSDIVLPYMYGNYGFSSDEIQFQQHTITISFLSNNKIKCTDLAKYMYLNIINYTWRFENSVTWYPQIRVYALNF